VGVKGHFDHVKLPRPNEKSGPLAGHVKKGRIYRSELAATGVLQIGDWVREKAAATRHCVVWLDDLENYLGTGGLTRIDIARVLTDKRSHRVIVATLRAAEEIRLTSETTGEDGKWQFRKDAREILWGSNSRSGG
jgi:hypothetical protein